MNNTPSAQSLLDAHHVYPDKHLGQNFLADEQALEDLMAAAELSSGDIVLEVGGGVGTVTRKIAGRVARVITIEKDARLVPILREQTKEFSNVEIIENDILQIPKRYKLQAPDLHRESTSDSKSQFPCLFKSEAIEYKQQSFRTFGAISYKLVGTPPYYLTARLFRTFLEEAPQRPALIALIIQKEVAQKICAKSPRMNLLALSVQVFGEPKIVRTLPQNAFWPEPSVDSAIIVVRVFPKPFIAENDIKQFFHIAKAAFAHPRQQVHKTLAAGLRVPRDQIARALKSADIDGHRRPQTVSVDEWNALLRALPLQ